MKPAGMLHRAISLLILLGLLVAIALFVVLPVRDTLREMDQTLATNAEVIRRLQAGTESLETYEAALALAQEAVRDDPRYLVADSPALASAALQQLVRRALEGAGATLRSIQDVPAAPRADGADAALAPTPVTVRTTVIATYPDILATLGEIGAETPYLLVDRLTVRSPTRAGASTEWPDLTVQFDVTGFLPPVVTRSQ